MSALLSPRRTGRVHPRAGFSLAELLISVAVIGILSGVLFSASRRFLGRDQANAAAAELQGWLEAVSARAVQYGPCTIRFNTGTNLQPGAPIAELSLGDHRCASGSSVPLPAVDTTGTYNLAVSFTPSGSSTIVFSPRGGVVADGVVATVKIAVNNAVPLRCVRIAFNALNVGRNNSSGNVADTCNQWDLT